MFLQCDLAVQSFAARNFVEKLWATDQKLAGKPAGIEGFYQQFEQSGIGDEQLEEQTAQAIGFNKPNKLIESCIGVRRFREPLEQNRTQPTECLARARRDMETGGALRQICQRLGRSFLVAENFQINFGWFGMCFGNDPFKNRAHTAHLFL